MTYEDFQTFAHKRFSLHENCHFTYDINKYFIEFSSERIYIQSKALSKRFFEHTETITIDVKKIKDITLLEDGILTINNAIAFNTKRDLDESC